MGLFGSKKKVEDASVGGEAVLGDGTRVQVIETPIRSVPLRSRHVARIGPRGA